MQKSFYSISLSPSESILGYETRYFQPNSCLKIERIERTYFDEFDSLKLGS